MATVVGVRTAGAWVGLAPVEMHTAAAATIACKALPALVRACMNELDLPFLFIGRRAFSLQFLGCLGTQFLMLEKETKVLFLPHGIEPVPLSDRSSNEAPASPAVQRRWSFLLKPLALRGSTLPGLLPFC